MTEKKEKVAEKVVRTYIQPKGLRPIEERFAELVKRVEALEERVIAPSKRRVK